MKNPNAELSFEIILHPQVVVAHKKINRDTRVADFCEFSQNAYKAFGHYSAVFKPKIKKVAEQKNSGSV